MSEYHRKKQRKNNDTNAKNNDTNAVSVVLRLIHFYSWTLKPGLFIEYDRKATKNWMNKQGFVSPSLRVGHKS